MIFRFKEFQFDTQQGLLSRDGVVVSLNEKSCQVLALLLEENDKVLSKSVILERIWPDRVVTEQVVFQNISQLRALFGDEAIRTFSKKGYQWQLPFEQSEQKNSKHDTAEVADAEEKETEERVVEKTGVSKKILISGNPWWLAFFSAVLFSVIAALLIFSDGDKSENSEPSQPNTVVYLLSPATGSSSNNGYQSEVLLNVHSQHLFDSPYRTWQENSVTPNQLLLATRYYDIADGVILRFRLQSSARGLHNYLRAVDRETAHKHLTELIGLLSDSGYLQESDRQAALAQLTLLATQQPQNAFLNEQLIALYFEHQDFNRALALLEQQIHLESSRLREGLLHLLKAKVTSWNKQHEVAKYSVQSALVIFGDLGLPQLEAEALIQQAWGHLVDQQFRRGMLSLNEAAAKARQSNEPLLEVTAHLNQAFMATKADQVELSYTQLDLAREMIELHELGEQHQVRVLNNAEWMADTREEKWQLSQRILDMSFTPLYELYFYVAAEKVRQYHIDNQQWQQALATIKPWQRSSFQLLARADIAFAQQQWQQATAHALEAYRVAQLDYHKIDALDAALLLLVHQQQTSDQVNVAELQEFIQQQATNRWIDQNRQLLTSMNLIQR